MSAGTDVFVGGVVRRELRRYRNRGPARTTRLLVDALRERGVEGATLLDIGGGVGAIQQELLAAGAAGVTAVDAAPQYVEAARSEAERRCTLDRVRLLTGDFVELAPDIEVSDLVTLDRVVCCYPHGRALLAASAARARRLYGLAFPRERFLVRVGVGLINLIQRVRRSPFRVYVHSTAMVAAELSRQGLHPVWETTTTLWRVALWERGTGTLPYPPGTRSSSGTSRPVST